MIGFVICGKPEFSGEYKQVKLVDVCEILDSKRIPITKNKRVTGPYPYYGANGIQDHVADYLFDDELVLLAEDGGHFEKDGQIAYRVSGKCWVNNHAHILKAKDEIDVDYLCYALQSFDVSSLVNGATRKKLTQSAMKKMSLPLRPVDVQIAIVGNLKTIELQLGNARKLLSSLDDLVKSRFNEMFGDGKYTEYELGSRMKTTSGGTPSRKHQEYYEGGLIPWLTSGEINKGKIDAPEHFITEKGLSHSAAKLVPANSVVVAMYGATAGQVGIVGYSTATNQAVCCIAPTDACDPVFLRFALEDRKKWMVRQCLGGAQPNISQGIIRKVMIPDAPIETQKSFAQFVAHVDKLRFMLLANPSPAFGGRLFCCSTNSCSGGVILDA